jgi:hypothetical protein
MNAEPMMANDLENTATPTADPRTVSHDYMLMPGVQLGINGADAQEYAHMRATHLKALLQVISMAEAPADSNVTTDIRFGALWLACTLAEELSELIDVVACDAEMVGWSPKGRT